MILEICQIGKILEGRPRIELGSPTPPRKKRAAGNPGCAFGERRVHPLHHLPSPQINGARAGSPTRIFPARRDVIMR